MNYTHYDYLDLAPGAPREGVEAAYARVLERFNYGAGHGQDLSGLVRMIHAAYEVLSNDDSRSAYDAILRREAEEADAAIRAELDARAARPARRVQEVPRPLYLAFSAIAA